MLSGFFWLSIFTFWLFFFFITLFLQIRIILREAIISPLKLFLFYITKKLWWAAISKGRMSLFLYWNLGDLNMHPVSWEIMLILRKFKKILDSMRQVKSIWNWQVIIIPNEINNSSFCIILSQDWRLSEVVIVVE